MLARRTNNQITLPKAVINRFSEVEMFDVSTDGDSIVLRPAPNSSSDDIRDDLEARGVTEQDVTAAISWARSKQ